MWRETSESEGVGGSINKVGAGGKYASEEQDKNNELSPQTIGRLASLSMEDRETEVNMSWWPAEDDPFWEQAPCGLKAEDLMDWGQIPWDTNELETGKIRLQPEEGVILNKEWEATEEFYLYNQELQVKNSQRDGICVRDILSLPTIMEEPGEGKEEEELPPIAEDIREILQAEFPDLQLKEVQREEAIRLGQLAEAYRQSRSSLEQAVRQQTKAGTVEEGQASTSRKRPHSETGGAVERARKRRFLILEEDDDEEAQS